MPLLLQTDVLYIQSVVLGAVVIFSAYSAYLSVII
jgi:hypothetical protein